MPRVAQKHSRRQHILQALAEMLELSPGERITTAGLAKQVGVSEAALYRHFPSKSKMFEGLIEFIEDAIFTRVNLILKEEPLAIDRCEKVLGLLLVFAEKNPGITRILTGDVLAGETEKLRRRVVQFYARLETQLKHILRDAEIHEGIRTRMTSAAAVNIMMATIEGKMTQYVRSEFASKPTQFWEEQWQSMMTGFFREAITAKTQRSTSTTKQVSQA